MGDNQVEDEMGDNNSKAVDDIEMTEVEVDVEMAKVKIEVN